MSSGSCKVQVFPGACPCLGSCRLCLWACHRRCCFNKPVPVLISGITWALLLCGEGEKRKGWEPVPISLFHKYWSCRFELHQRNRKASKTLAGPGSAWLPLRIPSPGCVCGMRAGTAPGDPALHSLPGCGDSRGTAEGQPCPPPGTASYQSCDTGTAPVPCRGE